MMQRGQRWLIGAGLLSLGGAAYGQDTSLERFERQLEQIQRDTRLRVDARIPAEQRVLVDYGGYTTFAFISVDDIQQDTHLLGQYDLSVYGRVNIDGAHEFFMRVRTSYRSFGGDGAGEDEFDDDDNGWQDPAVQIDRATYRFDLARHLAAYNGEQIPGNFIFQGGRQLVHWANGLVLSDDIDGGVITLNYRDATLLILAGITREENIDFDPSRPDFDEDTERGFYGAMFSYDVTPQHRPFIYGLVQRDYNDDETLSTDADGDGTADFDTKFEYDSWYLGFGSNGALSDQLLYAVEMVYEGGEGLSANPGNIDDGFGDQTEEDISAFAADARLDYMLADENRSRLTGEFLLATGDTDRENGATNTTLNGNRSGTDDHAYNSWNLVNTGLAFAPAVSNLIMVRLGASTFPMPNSDCFERMQVGVDTFVFHTFNENAPIDEPTDQGEGFLGGEIDLYVNWEITSDLSLAVRYGIFLPGEAVESNDDARHFFYTGLTFSF
jgi:hypothetical protein